MYLKWIWKNNELKLLTGQLQPLHGDGVCSRGRNVQSSEENWQICVGFHYKSFSLPLFFLKGFFVQWNKNTRERKKLYIFSVAFFQGREMCRVCAVSGSACASANEQGCVAWKKGKANLPPHRGTRDVYYFIFFLLTSQAGRRGRLCRFPSFCVFFCLAACCN